MTNRLGNDPQGKPVTSNLSGSATELVATQVADRCDQLIAVGEAQSRAGAIKLAENTLRDAASLAESLEDVERLTRIVLALPAWHWPGPGEANALALLLAQRGLAIEKESGGRRAVLMARLAAELSYTPERKPYSLELAAEAMRLATEGGDAAELYVRLYRDQLLGGPDQVSDRIVNCDEILRLSIEVGDYGASYIAAFVKSACLTLLGDIFAAQHAGEFATGIVVASQVKFHQGLSVGYRAFRAVGDGRFADARKHFDAVCSLAMEHNLPYLLDACWPAMLLPLGEQRQLFELEVVAQDTVNRRPSVPVFSALLAWLKVQISKTSDASFLLERLAGDHFNSLSSSPEGLVGFVALACVCSELDQIDLASILYEKLRRYSGLTATLSAVASFGSVDRYLGILASRLGHVDEAIALFEKSLRLDRRSGARPWAILSALELVSALMQRRADSDAKRASVLLEQAQLEAAGLGMTRALEMANALRENLADANHHSKSPNGSGGHSETAESADREWIFPGNAGSLPPPEQSSADGIATVFSRNGEYWHITYKGKTSSLRHRRGFELIALLLRDPGREFFATELAQERDSPAPGPTSEYSRDDNQSAPVLDSEAKRSYRERLREIRDDLESASNANDIERAAALQEEQDFITRELARAMGLFGRDRKFGSEAERARKRVSVAISRAIRLIALYDQEFARYLDRSIRTGNLCSYIPDPDKPLLVRL